MKHITTNRLIRRKRRVSANIFGTIEKPRIAVFRSNKHIYAQAIDDAHKTTVSTSSSLAVMKGTKEKIKKTAMAEVIGKELGKKLKEKKITKGVFDRSIYAYGGRVKAVAEGLRKEGIII